MKKLIMLLPAAWIFIQAHATGFSTAPQLPDSSGVLAEVWKSPIDSQGFEALSINPVLTSKGDLLTSRFSTRSKREPLILLDGKTGKKKWQWDDYFRDEEGFFDRCHVVDKDVIVLAARNATYAVNMNTGRTVWKHYMDTMYGSPFVFKDDSGYIYHSFRGEPGTFASYIFRTPANRLEWKPVCSILDSAGRTFSRRSVENMAFSVNSRGEPLLFFTLWIANTIDDPNTVIACYNMGTRSYEWIRNYTKRFNEWGHTPSVADHGLLFTYAYYGNDHSLIAISMNDGSIAWEQAVSSAGVGLYAYKNTIISTLRGESPVSAYEASSGKVIWKQAFTGAERSGLNFSFGSDHVYKRYLLSTQCSKLLVLDLDNGAVLFNKGTGSGCMEHGVAVNGSEGVLYVQDRTHMNCFRLPRAIR
jgi:outer membrane protein assembly factor BamB